MILKNPFPFSSISGNQFVLDSVAQHLSLSGVSIINGGQGSVVGNALFISKVFNINLEDVVIDNCDKSLAI